MSLSSRVLLAISALTLAAFVGCGGSGMTVVSGSGGAMGTGGVVNGTGGQTFGGTGGQTVGGTGGEMIGSGGASGTGGQSGEPDAAAPDAAGGQPDAARTDGGAADGGIANCVANARCRSMRVEPTCMAPCPGGTERVCRCSTIGRVVCAACPRVRPDAGATDAADARSDTTRPRG